MDVKLKWKISSDVESLVETIVECRRLLVAGCAARNKSKTNLLSCDAFAGHKLIELLQLSEMWSPCVEFTEEDLRTAPSRRQKKTTTLMANFSLFKLHCMEVLGEEAIRVVVECSSDDSVVVQTYYGNVEIIDEKRKDVAGDVQAEVPIYETSSVALPDADGGDDGVDADAG